MKNRLLKEIVFRSFYLAFAAVATISSFCFWNIGQGTAELKADFGLLANYFVWTVIMSIICTAAALIEAVRLVADGRTDAYTKKFPFLKFCTLSSMIFCFLMGAFFVCRVGENYLLPDAAFGQIYPGIITRGYWLDLSVFTARFLCPLMYITMYLLFEQKGKARKIYAKLGIIPPTVFYLANKIFGVIMANIHGGEEALLAKGLFAKAYPFFFYDGYFTYTHKIWILLWPSIFGLSLIIINKLSFLLSCTYKTPEGKLLTIKKPQINEAEMVDIFHRFKKNK